MYVCMYVCMYVYIYSVFGKSLCTYTRCWLEVMSTSVYTGLNLFNFIPKHFLQICVRKVAVHL
jgi:hypothetical protein